MCKFEGEAIDATRECFVNLCKLQLPILGVRADPCKKCRITTRPQKISENEDKIKDSQQLKLVIRNKTKKFFCLMKDCKSSFNSQSQLRKHVNNVHTPKVKCPHTGCQAQLKKSSLVRHIRIHDNAKRSCEKCGETVPYASYYTHLDKCGSNGVRRFLCSIKDCKASFVNKSGLSTHFSTVHRSPIKCPQPNCNKYLKPFYLKSHIKQVHEKVKRSCEICGKIISLLAFRGHFEKCSSDGVKKFFCSTEGCQASFVTRYELSWHFQKAHKIRPPSKTCSNCGKMISHQNMTTHLRLCTGDRVKRFFCSKEHCNSGFLTKSRLTTHLKNVHGLMSVKCPRENCNALVKPNGLDRHIERVHDKIRESCENCGKSVSIGTLKRHFESCTGHGLERYFCDVKDCQATFKARHLLLHHVRLTHNSVPVKCPIKNCEKFVKSTSLVQHIKTVHEKIKDTCENCGRRVYPGTLKRHLKSCRARKE